MAIRNSTGDRLARAVVRRNRNVSARQRTRAALRAARNWLSAPANLPRVLGVVLILASVLIPTGIKGDPGHSLNRLPFSGVCHG